MPDDSCRTCGGELIKHSRCSECRKIIQKMCTMCNLKTHKEFHPKCMKSDLYQISNTDSITILRNKNPKANLLSKNNAQIMLVSGLVAVTLFGLIFAYYDDLFLFYNNPKTTENDKKSPSAVIDEKNPLQTTPNQVSNVPTYQFKAQYANCLGISDGNSLTINCPTDYGMTYRAIVEIPNELVSQFESKSFHMRGFSISEHSSGLLIEYKKQTYTSEFIAH